MISGTDRKQGKPNRAEREEWARPKIKIRVDSLFRFVVHHKKRE